MFGLAYHKARPSEFVFHYQRGQLARQGAGLSFLYFRPVSALVVVPLASVSVPFAFHESTADFQTVTVQGQLTYRIADPAKCAQMFNFTIDERGGYISDDYQHLPDRLVHSLQTLVRSDVQSQALGAALTSGDELTARVLPRLAASAEVRQMGIEILSLAILALRPTPDMAKALEAEAREALNRRADDAIYARRNAAIEQERRIQENELETKKLVQLKHQELQERELTSQIALETQRSQLTTQKADNDRLEADARAYALKAVLGPVQGLDWRMLMMLNPNGGDARNTIALAFQELAANAQKIGEVNVSPDLLRSLMASRESR